MLRKNLYSEIEMKNLTWSTVGRRLARKRSNQDGFVLIDAIFSVQILLMVVLFVIVAALYYRSVTIDNSYRQAALYNLETEMEYFLAIQNREYRLTGEIWKQHDEKTIVVGDRTEIVLEIDLSWQNISPTYGELMGRATWSRPGLVSVKGQEVELYTTYYLR